MSGGYIPQFHENLQFKIPIYFSHEFQVFSVKYYKPSSILMYTLLPKTNIFYVLGVPKGIYPQLSVDQACTDPQWGTSLQL